MRPAVKWFAEQMEKTLQMHDEAKGDEAQLSTLCLITLMA